MFERTTLLGLIPLSKWGKLSTRNYLDTEDMEATAFSQKPFILESIETGAGGHILVTYLSYDARFGKYSKSKIAYGPDEIKLLNKNLKKNGLICPQIKFNG